MFFISIYEQLIFIFLMMTRILTSYVHIRRKIIPIEEEVILLKKAISIPFTLNELNQIIVNVCLGTDHNCYPFKVATNIDHCFIYEKSLSPNGYDYKESSTAEIEESFISFEIQNKKLEGYVIRDTIIIPNTKINLTNFPFYVINKGDVSKNYVGVLGLGKKYLDNFMSLLSMLYMNNQLNHLSFSLFYEGDGGILKLGYHEANDPREYKTCDIVDENDDEDPFFETILYSMIFEEEKSSEDNNVQVYNQQQTVWLSPGASWVYCPESFFNFLIQYTFKRFIDSNACSVSEVNNKISVIQCKDDILNENLGELLFIFGKWNLKEKLNKFFENCGNQICFGIAKFEGENKWILGYPFLKRHPIFFDFDNFLIKIKRNVSAFS